MYKFESAYEWLKWAYANKKIYDSDLLLLLATMDDDTIQDQFESIMDETGYFDKMNDFDDNE